MEPAVCAGGCGIGSRWKRAATERVVLSAGATRAALTKPPPCRTQACQAHADAGTLRFFATHPRLARTPAGQAALLAVLARKVARLEGQVRRLQAARREPRSNYDEARRAIYAVFGVYADQAMRVSYCETGGTYDPRAQNGQYLGIFQMGDYARSTYGHGGSWLDQARAAYAYFADSGYGWGPWECKPW